MEPLSIYRKSAKGSEAIGARLHGLVGRPRSLLILVDGKRSQAELLALAAGFGDVPQMLAKLESGGFIEPVPGAASTPGSPTGPVPVAALPAAAGLTLAQAKTFACRTLTGALGPTANPLCERVESAHSRADYIAALQQAFNVVREIRGPSVAEKFGAAIEGNLPSG